MRCVWCALSVCLVLGCRNQGTPIANPFLTPDRVPPPSTRVLQPGTAQPYYAGDPVPQLPQTGFPAQTFQQTPIQQAPIQPNPAQQPPPSYGTPQPVGSPTTPPGGWNSYPQSSPGPSSHNTAPNRYIQPSSAEFPLGASGNGAPTASDQIVRVQSDQQNLRFASTPATNFGSAPPVDPYFQSVDPRAPAQTSAPIPTQAQPSRLPLQTVLPSQQQSNQFFATSGTTQSTSPAAPPLTQQVRIRELSSADLGFTNQSPVPATNPRGQDGFRPQGSFRNDIRSSQFQRESNQRPAAYSGVKPAQHVAQWDNAQRFGFDPNYAWLRGQIEYLQSTGQWKLRYVPIQGAASGQTPSRQAIDQFGGSVVIENPHVLGNLQPGDFVQVRGSLRSRQQTDVSYSPIYTVSVVQRQRQ